MRLQKAIAGGIDYALIQPARQEPRVLLLAVATMFITMGQGIVIPTLPLLVRSLGMSAAMVGFAVSAFALARVFLNLPSGIMTKVLGARAVLVGGAAISALGNLATGMVTPYWALVASRFLAGLGSAMFITAAVIFVATVSDNKNRGRLMTIYQTAFLLGITLGPSVGGITASLFGLRSPFFVVAAVSALSGVWAMARIPADVARSGSPVARTSPNLTERLVTPTHSNPKLITASFLAISFTALAVFFTRGGALFNLFPLHAREDLGLSLGQVGLIMTIPAITNLVFQPFVGALSDKFGRRAMMLPGLATFGLSLIISAIGSDAWLFALALTLYGLGQAVESPTGNSFVADITPPSQRAVGLGIYRTCADVGLVFGSPIMGYITDISSLAWAFILNSCIVFLAWLAFFIWAKTPKKTQAPT